MLYGYTPFRGKTRQKTFANVLQKDLKFPKSIQVKSCLQISLLLLPLQCHKADKYINNTLISRLDHKWSDKRFVFKSSINVGLSLTFGQPLPLSN